MLSPIGEGYARSPIQPQSVFYAITISKKSFVAYWLGHGD